jgi:3-oxocholest-4-en-26-oyl-CoA dehydrogenase alpha subunit
MQLEYTAEQQQLRAGGANEIQRDIIAMAGLLMPRAPRDLRATATGKAG